MSQYQRWLTSKWDGTFSDSSDAKRPIFELQMSPAQASSKDGSAETARTAHTKAYEQ